MAKHFKNVKEVVKGLATDKKFKKNALEELKNKNIAKFLFTLRCEHNLTQKQLAERVGCTQSKISKIESSFDNELAVKDLIAYGEVLNLQLEVGYRNISTKIVDLIKYHAFKIKHYLEQLDELVQDDEDMAKEILRFHLEAFANLSNFTLKSIPVLQKKSIKQSKKLIHLSSPLTDKLQEEEKKKEEKLVNMS
ncbi:MAG: helix-turn-helix domain-containing protein [Planctomycetota bacterium]|jgi:transcriptional regulator with XRE-family HTH domain